MGSKGGYQEIGALVTISNEANSRRACYHFRVQPTHELLSIVHACPIRLEIGGREWIHILELHHSAAE